MLTGFHILCFLWWTLRLQHLYSTQDLICYQLSFSFHLLNIVNYCHNVCLWVRIQNESLVRPWDGVPVGASACSPTTSLLPPSHGRLECSPATWTCLWERAASGISTCTMRLEVNVKENRCCPLENFASFQWLLPSTAGYYDLRILVFILVWAFFFLSTVYHLYKYLEWPYEWCF